MTDVAAVLDLLAAEKLCVLGSFDEDGRTTAMIGPDEPAGYWQHFQNSAEARDGKPHPIDRWSERTLGAIAADLNATALFPFGGPPYHPFFTWAIKTGRIHASPVQLLVHADAGLWVSFRGALVFSTLIDFGLTPDHPCETCVERPCLAACPAGALTGDGYDVPACKTFLEENLNGPCMTQGCRVRAVCPAGQSWQRDAAQSAHHMKAFLAR